MTSRPVLSMLWESGDAIEALTTRFGFTSPASAADWISEVVRDIWAIRVDDCDRLVISDTNVLAWITSEGNRFIAKWSVAPHAFQRLADMATLTSWLAARALPVAAPIPAADGRLRVVLNDVSLGVLPVIDGDLLDVDDPDQVTEAGRMLATLHEALASYPDPIDGSESTGQRQLVHNDFRSANILHDGARITAILDFEEVTYTTRVADLGKAAVLLGTRYHHWAPTSPAVREQFIAAYCDQAPLTSSEQNALPAAITAVLDHFGWNVRSR